MFVSVQTSSAVVIICLHHLRNIHFSALVIRNKQKLERLRKAGFCVFVLLQMFGIFGIFSLSLCFLVFHLLLILCACNCEYVFSKSNSFVRIIDTGVHTGIDSILFTSKSDMFSYFHSPLVPFVVQVCSRASKSLNSPFHCHTNTSISD